MFDLSLRQMLVGGAAVAVLGVVAVAVFALSGLYNVSASREHFDATTWLLDLVRRQSIRTHSLGVGDPPRQSAGAVRLGAVHYELGCAACHGAPGRPASALQDAMLPSPPPFTDGVRRWSPKQLYWIVLNGQKYTGMPSWVAPRRRDEIWPMVAFLTRLSALDAAAYRELAGLGEGRRGPGLELGTGRTLLEVCARCHGAPGAAPPIDMVPSLSGQSHAYLARALREYAEGKRPSGYMQLVAADLDDDVIRELAAAYAQAPAPPPSGTPTANAALLRRGEAIAREGLPGKGVPACLACHVDAGNPAFPRILGLPAHYVEQQLQLFQTGKRHASAFGAIMGAVSSRLDPDDMEAVAAYLSAVPAGEAR
ncbi:MAG: c-type cytochrome [Pseudomonadota bacterium]